MQKYYYYKTADKKGLWKLKSPLSTKQQQEYAAIEIDELEHARIVKALSKAAEPTAAQKAKAQKVARINELKRKLAETDYEAIKFAEGWFTEEEYAETKALRQSWRAEINQLEEELA